MNHQELIKPIKAFLLCETPEGWLKNAADNIDVLLVDHAHCEKKAASTGLSLVYRYVDKRELLLMLSQLVREEMLHFEQVLEMMENRGVNYGHLGASGYASSLHDHVKKSEPQRLIDNLIIGAIIEARSCERFYALSEYFEDLGIEKDLVQYYRYLLKSESRHFEDYLHLARLYDEGDTDGRIKEFLELEKGLIQGEDEVYRFHSGVPV